MPEVKLPTAMQAVSDAQDTELNSARVCPPGVSGCCNCHLTPFQCSAIARWKEPDTRENPTAVQPVSAGHDTAVR